MGRGQRTPTTPPYQMGSRTIVAPMAIEVYGQGAVDPLPEYDSLLLEFPRDLTETEKERAAGILAYWAKLPFVANGSTENRWLADNQIWIDANSNNSKSADWRLRRPFEMLEDLMVEGTEPRKRQNNTRAFEGLGIAPGRIILSHPQHPEPALPKRPKRKLSQASDLLSHR